MSKDLYESDVHVFGTRSKNSTVLIKAAPGKSLIVEGAFTGDEALPDGQIKIGNVSNISESRAITGDISLSRTGVVTLDTVNSGPGTTTLSTVTTNGKGLVTANTSATLDNTKVWIGNGSNVPIQQSIGGDATLAADGTMTLSTVTSALNDVNLARVSVDAKGRITSTSTTPLGSAQVFIGNGSNVPTATSISGDLSLSNTGVVTIPTVTPAKGGTGLTATPTNGQVPIGNGSGYTLSTLTAANGVAVTNASGSITVGLSSTVVAPGILYSVGRLETADTTASTSKTTGALIVAGGAGIAGTLYTNSLVVTNRSYGYVSGRSGQSIGTGTTFKTLTTYWNGTSTTSGSVSFSSGVFTVSRAGIYNVSATVNWGAANIGTICMVFSVNDGVPSDLSSTVPAYGLVALPSPTSGTTCFGSTANIFLNANDNVRVKVYHGSGGSVLTSDYWAGWFAIAEY